MDTDYPPWILKRGGQEISGQIPISSNGKPKGSNPQKNPFTFGPKGVGVTPKSKSFGVFFGAPSFGHYGGKGRGLNLFQKCLGSFEVVLRLFCGGF